ncbi:MAG: hypothetical protein HY818_14065 [Acetobacterium woodii]|nr:hypothetical protein [Acetobacterium woodii]
MEKIRSGQAFLYREKGLHSTVIDTHMKETICGDSLKKALAKAIQRYPYLSQKMIEQNGDFYLIENPMPFVLDKPSELHSLGSAEINYHLIDVTYQDQHICVAFHHGLCDGQGIKPFVETLLYYYCTYKYQTKFNAPLIKLAGEPLLPDETKEPLGDGKFDVLDADLPVINKDGYALPDAINQSDEKTYYRYEVNINQSNFIKFAKENNATPSIAMALLTSQAIKNIYPDADKPILCNLASNMRPELNLDHTYKNCVNSLYLPYSVDLEKLTFKDQAIAYRKMLNEQKQPNVVKTSANSMVYLSDKLDELPSYEAKQKMMSFFNNISLNTFIISYMGQSQLGECEQHIDSMHMYSSGTTGLVLNMLSVGENITIDFLQSFETEKYINAFIHVLNESDLDFKVSEQIEFRTPSDTASRQSQVVA